MADEITREFSYHRIQRLLHAGCYNPAIAMLTRRIEGQPFDRAARLFLLLANLSKFGPGEFNREIEELRFIDDLSGNERYIVQQIFLVGFKHAAQTGQTIQKSVYQSLLRQLMLGKPLDGSMSETREIEEECGDPSCAEVISHNLGVSEMKPFDDEPEMEPLAPTELGRWSQLAMIGAGALITSALLGFYLGTGRKAPLAHEPPQPLALIDSGMPIETGTVRNPPAIVLAPTFTAEPARRLIVSHLEELSKAYARWAEKAPFPSGTLSLKLNIEPSGNIGRVEEVVSRLSEHRFLDAVVAEVKQWKLPLGRTKAGKISVPLIFIPAEAGPPQSVAQEKFREPGAARQEHATTPTSFAGKAPEPVAPGSPIVAKNQSALQAHIRGRLEGDADREIISGAKGGSDAPKNAAVKPELAGAFTPLENEAATAGTVVLKQAPRFAADAIESVDLGTRVTVLRKERDWIKVKVNISGNVGYMRKEYLAISDTNP